MESSICVAVITCFPTCTAMAISLFCTDGTSSSAISTPRSPRATISPSETARISSILSSACRHSIFAMICVFALQAFRISLICKISSFVLTKDAAIKSNPCSAAYWMSALSFSDKNGILSFAPGRLTPLRSEICPSLSTLQTISVSVTCSVRKATSPSSIRMI